MHIGEAVLQVLQLRRVLGRKHGEERQRPDPIAQREAPAGDDKIIDLPRRDPASTDPAIDWTAFDRGMREVVARPDLASASFAHPMAGTMPLGSAIDMLVTPDVFMHSWDLARASGQSITLDADYSAGLLAGMEGIEEVLRSSGHYGPRVTVADDADVTTRLMAFIGRDPHWRTGR